MPIEERSQLARLCASSLGLTVVEVLTIVRIGPLRYKMYHIPKRNGGERLICQPSRELKAVQRFLLSDILADLPVHPAATAYEAGSSIKRNATRHVGSRVILKLDFKDFFNSITVEDWLWYAREAFPQWSGDDLIFSARSLFFGAKTPNPRYLSIGAPTSPHLANALLFQFDEAVSGFCQERRLVYTRYADDITISSCGYLDQRGTISFLLDVLRGQEHPRLILNDAKTKLYSRAASRRVTGVVLTNDAKISLGRERKRLIHAMVHRDCAGGLNSEDHERLRGLIAFATDIEPSFVDSLRAKYGDVNVLLTNQRTKKSARRT